LPTGTVVKVQATRSRSQNRKLARQLLAERVEEIEKGASSRVAIVGEVKKKRKSSAVKKSKRKYRLLEAAKSSLADVDKNGANVESLGASGVENERFQAT
jgi:peptide chain release factor